MPIRPPEQVEVFPGLTESRPFRPIHYLGSKLRLVPALSEVVGQLDSRGGRLCDLFAGSGTVAAAFSQSRDVVAVDVQEYARVLCSAVLHPAELPEGLAQNILATANNSALAERLSSAIAPLAEYEELCIGSALTGAPEALCDLLEVGSLFAFERTGGGNRGSPLSEVMSRATKNLTRMGLGESQASIVTRYFGGVYFSFRQAVTLDLLLQTISETDPAHQTTLLAAVLSCASDAVNTVGKQFAQPLRPRKTDGTPKPRLGEQVRRDRELSIESLFVDWTAAYRQLPRSNRAHLAVRSDYREFLRTFTGEVGVIYADPPYTRDHYSRFYHVLETMCLRDNPDVSTNKVGSQVRLSRGGYRAERHQSPFCIRSEAGSAFEALFSGAQRFGSPIVLSYSPYDDTKQTHPRCITVDQIVSIAKRYFGTVETVSAGPIKHNKLNATARHLSASEEAELFVLCRP